MRLGYIISGAKHSPLSSSIRGHHIVEIQEFDLDGNSEEISRYFIHMVINCICVSKYRSNENSIIMLGLVW